MPNLEKVASTNIDHIQKFIIIIIFPQICCVCDLPIIHKRV